jgi:hypothetical protein
MFFGGRPLAVDFPNKRVLAFDDDVIDLQNLDAKSYVSIHNPAALALAARMGRGGGGRRILVSVNPGTSTAQARSSDRRRAWNLNGSPSSIANPEERRRIAERCESSGLSQREFARRHRLSLSSPRRWLAILAPLFDATGNSRCVC